MAVKIFGKKVTMAQTVKNINKFTGGGNILDIKKIL